MFYIYVDVWYILLTTTWSTTVCNCIYVNYAYYLKVQTESRIIGEHRLRAVERSNWEIETEEEEAKLWRDEVGER